MGKECAEKLICDHCGYILQSRDCHEQIVRVNNGQYPPEDIETVLHCICYQCGEEWVE